MMEQEKEEQIEKAKGPTGKAMATAPREHAGLVTR